MIISTTLKELQLLQHCNISTSHLSHKKDGSDCYKAEEVKTFFLLSIMNASQMAIKHCDVTNNRKKNKAQISRQGSRVQLDQALIEADTGLLPTVRPVPPPSGSSESLNFRAKTKGGGSC